ncbi:hypothetical protein RRG08_020684 [Elysia crispata]|uniref:Uncharacterized protein n=1 Tax=Elysia crispata TaxID=231223 RepID=A0AAE0Z4K4_9GAST|nr:hypothetical protein RRG08_020684 [Elysia crispata]
MEVLHSEFVSTSMRFEKDSRKCVSVELFCCALLSIRNYLNFAAFNDFLYPQVTHPTPEGQAGETPQLLPVDSVAQNWIKEVHAVVNH